MSREVYEYVEPLPNMVVVTEPTAIGATELRRTESGLYLPAEHAARRSSFGLVCKVIRPAEDMAADFPAGSSVLIHEFAGLRIYSESSATRVFLVSRSDILAKVSDDYWNDVVDAAKRESDEAREGLKDQAGLA